QPVAPGTRPAEAVERALAELERTAARPGVHSAVVLADPRHWELLHFTLWDAEAPEEPGEERYQVLHLSRPELDKLPAGRHW
ncbi:MAG: DUF4865 family protein, partial [Streptomyces sp.]|nr:DUF4865 family protein [Streptomyces sp.]